MNLANRTVKSRMIVVAMTSVLILPLGEAARAGEAQPPPHDNWSHVGHDATNSNFNPGETKLNASNVSKIRPAWTSQTNIFGTWVVSAGRVIRLENGVKAARVSDGSTLWSFSFEDCWNPYRAVAGPKRVFVYSDNGCSQTGATDEALVTAFDSRTGEVLWERGPSQWVLWMGLVGNHLLLETEGPFGIMSLDPATGDVQWSRADDALDGAFAADHRHVYYAGWDYNADQCIVASFDLADGDVQWSRPLSFSYASEVVVGGRRLFIEGAAEGTFETTTLVAKKTTGASLYELPGVSVAGYQPGVLFTEGDEEFGATTNTLQARKDTTGRLLWSRKAGGTWQQLTLANGLAYTARQQGNRFVLYIYRVDDGRVVVKRRMAYDRVLAVTGGTLYMVRGLSDDAVVALRVPRRARP